MLKLKEKSVRRTLASLGDKIRLKRHRNRPSQVHQHVREVTGGIAEYGSYRQRLQLPRTDRTGHRTEDRSHRRGRPTGLAVRAYAIAAIRQESVRRPAVRKLGRGDNRLPSSDKAGNWWRFLISQKGPKMELMRLRLVPRLLTVHSGSHHGNPVSSANLMGHPTHPF